MTTEHKNIDAAMLAAQMEFGTVVKGATNPAFKTRYADLADVCAVVIPTLCRHGVTARHYTVGEKLEHMRTEFKHAASGTRVWCDIPMITDKNNMQGMKSASTYAKRIGIESLSGIAPEDDDGNAAVANKPRAVPVNTNPAQDEPGGADDVAAKWAAWGRAEIDKLKVSGFDREALASWDASNRKHFTKLQKAAPVVHDELMAVVDAMNEAFDRFHPINAG